MYNQIKSLGSKKIDKIIHKLNLEDKKHIFKNASTIKNLLEKTHYNGDITEQSIINHFIQFHDTMIQTGDDHYTIDDYVVGEALPNLRTIQSKEKSKEYEKFYRGVDRFINSIDNTPLPGEAFRKREGNLIEKTNGRKFTIDFTKYNDEDKDIILNDLMSKFWERFLSKITLEQKWSLHYQLKNGKWYQTSIHTNNIDDIKEYLRNQIWNVVVDEIDLPDSDKPFCADFQFIQKMEFYDYTPYPNIKKPKRGLNANKKYNAPVIGNTYDKRNGRFWKWTLDMPSNILNLERYQIYNNINESTIKSMAKTHCLIYALEQFGIPLDITEDIKTYITHGHFPMSKLNEISESSGINFSVRYYSDINDKPKHMKFEVENAKYTVNLLLYQEHYMLDEDVEFNTQYIKYREQMGENPANTKNWTINDMLRVKSYDKKENKYKKYRSDEKPKTSLPKLLKTLFEYDLFKPITFNDYNIYCSNLYKENLEESAIIAINEKDTRLIEDFKDIAVKENIENVKKFVFNELNEKYYDRESIFATVSNRIKNDPEHKYELKFIDGKLRESITERHPMPSCLIFADFECSTNGEQHKEYCICADKVNTKTNKLIEHFEYFDPETCAVKFLDWCDDGAYIYFHNLTYDMNFLLKHFDKVKGNPIIFNGRDMSYNVIYAEKQLTIRDSYAMISSKLESFPSMFKLDSGEKEAFPYSYYTSDIVMDAAKGNINDAMKYVKPSLREQFIKNINNINGVKINDDEFDMKKYALFYCNQDVRILREGFCKFRCDMLEALDIDCIKSLSISSVADKYFKREIYYKNGNLYEVSGILQRNISKCVIGGRCMTADNKKQIEEGEDHIVDFDAVSLYPSAIHRLYVLEGKPKVIPRAWKQEYLLSRLFDDDQVKPTKDKNISGFFVKIHIDEIGIERHFPLIVFNPALNPDMDPDIPRSSNVCCNMWCDHITLQDLIRFQRIKYTLLGGYYYSGNRDVSCRDVIQNLFELRLKYKKEDNPLQNVIKLILNSIYGKTIIKPIEHKHVFIKKEDTLNYHIRNFNDIVSSYEIDGGNLTKFKVITPINKHYNFSPFGINILAMSKRIMNEVFCLAEDMGKKIFYQDTDSGHYYEDDIKEIAEAYRTKYGRELIGKQLGQFHTDFANIDNNAGMPVAIKSIFLGKKSYIDMLTDDKNNIAFHARMKGITPNAIVNKANEMFPDSVNIKYEGGLYVPLRNEGVDGDYSIYNLYKYLYDGNSVEFDLVDEFSPCFDFKENKTIISKEHFFREVRF